MSRLTATEVIAQGRYLEPDFEPSSLTVSQLLGVLGYHNIKYPTPYSKPKLVQVFKDEIKANTGRLSRQRLKAESSIASDDGITDGITGRPIGGASKASEPAPAPARRASRRLSRAPPEQDETEPPRPDPPKRRRSSAQPSLGGSSKPTSGLQPTVQPTVAEESEPDEDELPARKVSRSKKKIGGPSSRRKSLAEDSGWEDNNIFQSGAESSSPVRPSPRPKPRRPSARKSRKSASAPPQSSPLSSPIKASRADGLPQSRFEPQLPLVPYSRSRIFEEQKAADVMEEEIAETQPYNDDEAEAEEEGEDIESQDTKQANSELAFPDSRDTVVAMRQEPFIPPAIQILLWLVGLIGAILATNYKIESSSIGYCDANSETNSALEDVRAKREAIQLCNQENRTTLYVGGGSPCPLLPFIPADLHSDSCTPCPDHAMCRQDTVICDSGYILRPHPLFFFIPAVASPTKVTLSASSPPNELAWKVISELMNGLPGMGSVAFPPRCVEDPKRKRHIGALGKAVEHILAHRRGELLCSGVSEEMEESEEGEAKKWGMELDGLRSKMRDMTAPHLIPTFDDMFNEAIQQLVEWGGIMISEDSEGVRYIAHKTPALSLACTVIVESRGIWRAWRVTVLGIVTAGASIFALRSRNARNKESMKRVAEIVPTALKAIRDAEMAHHTDPITSPYSYVSSLQLRDLLLPHEPLSERDALWQKVSRVVEQNTNIRANFEEANGGDEMRVWRWIGGGAGVQRQLSPEQEKTEGIDGGASD